MSAVKTATFEYEANEAVRSLLESFRMMVNQALWVGMHTQIRGHFRLIKEVHEDFKRYGLHSHYTLGACEVASAILKKRKSKHRAPVARRLFLKLDNQSYKLQGEVLRIPIRSREFLNLKLKMAQFHKDFLDDASLKLGSLTITEDRVIVAFRKTLQPCPEYRSVAAYDTNERSLDCVLSTGTEIKSIRNDLSDICRVRAMHFERRRQLQTRLAHCQRRLKAKLAYAKNRERRRVDAILHATAKRQIRLAAENGAKIVLEDLTGVRRSVNRRVKKRNVYNGKIQSLSVRSKSLKRRLNTWPFRKLHQFIEYKSKWENIQVCYAPAMNTSRTCPMCGCLQAGHEGEQDPKTRQVFQCPKCGWRCDRHFNAALNLLKTQDEGRWFSPDRLLHEVMTAMRAYEEEVRPRRPDGT